MHAELFHFSAVLPVLPIPTGEMSNKYSNCNPVAVHTHLDLRMCSTVADSFERLIGTQRIYNDDHTGGSTFTQPGLIAPKCSSVMRFALKQAGSLCGAAGGERSGVGVSLGEAESGHRLPLYLVG